MANFLAERTRRAEIERQQELLACELAHADIGASGGAALTWFCTSVLWRTRAWLPMACMALLDQNKAGQLRWRVHPRPLKLLNWITNAAAWKWQPELHFDGDERAAHQATRPNEIQMSSLDRQDDEGNWYNQAEANWQCGTDAWHPRGNRPRGIPMADAIDIPRAKFIDELCIRWGLPTGAGFERPVDPVLFDEDELVEQALQRAALATTQRRATGLEWLRGRLSIVAIGPRTAAACVRMYLRDFAAFRAGLEWDRICLLGEDRLEEEQLAALERLDIPAAAQQTLLRVGFTGNQAELVFHKLCGVGREELKTLPGWEDTFDEAGNHHSKAEATWQAVNRRLKEPGLKTALRKAMAGDLSGIEQQREERLFLQVQAKFLKTNGK
jgi:hypothetical protein